jgi:2-keto-4-pentenoate hydratase/2-oxohepta-3-ene-1,7-dioic acid hydratase in catechol pathway
MRLVSFHIEDGIHFGVVDNDRVVDLVNGPCAAEFQKKHACQSVLELLNAGSVALDDARRAADIGFRADEQLLSLDQIHLAAPIPRPGKVLALAGNYGEHLRESGHEWADKQLSTPRLFMKPVTAVTGPYDPIIYPPNGNNIDYEGEFGVVIGKRARFVAAAEAWDHVAGYLVIDDVSERSLKIDADRQDRSGDKWFDWLGGKWFDTFAPMGPALVLKDEVPDPQSLSLQTRVNGELRQDASTAQMIFDVAELIEWASRWMTLEPGDVIATGTPAGVGSSTGTFLKPGDVVEIEIGSIGAISNTVEQKL